MYYFTKIADSRGKLPKLKRAMSPSAKGISLTSRKKVYESLPALHEPLHVKYDRKALFNHEAQRSKRNYKVYKPKGTMNHWENIQIFGSKKPRNYLEESIKRGMSVEFLIKKNNN